MKVKGNHKFSTGTRCQQPHDWATREITELDEQVTGKVKFGDGSTLKFKGKGSVTFQYKNEEEQMLTEVYYIPSLCNNIISLGQLSKAGNKVILEDEYLWVYESSGRFLMKVKKRKN